MGSCRPWFQAGRKTRRLLRCVATRRLCASKLTPRLGIHAPGLPFILGLALTGTISIGPLGGWAAQSSEVAAAKQLVEKGRFSEAQRILESVLLQPARPPVDVYYHLAVCHARLGKPDAALQNLDIVLDEEPSHLPALHLKAYLRFAEGRYGEALKLATESLEKQPNGGETRKISGLARFMLGDKVGAERDLRNAVQSLPKDFDAHYYLGRLYFEQSKLALALELFEMAITLDPGSVKAHNHRGQTLEGLTRYDDASSAYRDAIEIEGSGGERSEWPYYNLGSLLLAEGHASKAVELLGMALERNPSSIQTKTRLGTALSAASRLEEAEAHLRSAVKAEPRNADAHYQLGRLLMKLGNSHEGRRHLALFERLREP